MYDDVAKDKDIFKIEYPKTLVPSPDDSDYELGFIRRYFVQRANDSYSHIFEIDEEVHANYSDDPFWVTGGLKWRIAGPLEATYKEDGQMDDKGVRASNTAAIALASQQLRNLKLYLPNLLQFYKGSL